MRRRWPPPRRRRVPFLPAVGRRGALRRRHGRDRQAVVGLAAHPLDRPPPRRDVPARAPVLETRQVSEVSLGARQGAGCLHDGGVRENAAGRQVTPPGDLVPLFPQFPDDGQSPAGVHPVDARGPPPRIRARAGRLGGQYGGEFLPRPFGLALGRQHHHEGVPQFHQQLDVQRRVAEQFGRQRAGGPVGGRVALFQRPPQHRFHQRAEADPGEAEQPAGQLGVEQPPRAEPELGQAGQVLGGGVQHHLGVAAGPGRRGARTGSRTRAPRPRRPGPRPWPWHPQPCRVRRPRPPGWPARPWGRAAEPARGPRRPWGALGRPRAPHQPARLRLLS